MKMALQQQGEKYALEFDKEALAEWAIDPASTLEVRMTDGVLTAVAVGDADLSGKIDAAMARLVKRYDATFKKLAE